MQEPVFELRLSNEEAFRVIAQCVVGDHIFDLTSTLDSLKKNPTDSKLIMRAVTNVAIVTRLSCRLDALLDDERWFSWSPSLLSFFRHIKSLGDEHFFDLFDHPNLLMEIPVLDWEVVKKEQMSAEEAERKEIESQFRTDDTFYEEDDLEDWEPDDQIADS